MQVVSIDCEMVAVDTGRMQIFTDGTDALARIVVIDSNFDVLYDSFVQPKFKVVNYRYGVTGIKNTDLYGPKSKPFDKVQLEIKQLLKNKIIVGHSVFHDFDALGLLPEARQIRDTQTFPPFQNKSGHKAPALTHLSEVVLNFDLRRSREQRHNHCPIEDAKIVMKLYLLVSEMWEAMVQSGEYLYSYENSRLSTSNFSRGPNLQCSLPNTGNMRNIFPHLQQPGGGSLQNMSNIFPHQQPGGGSLQNIHNIFPHQQPSGGSLQNIHNIFPHQQPGGGGLQNMSNIFPHQQPSGGGLQNMDNIFPHLEQPGGGGRQKRMVNNDDFDDDDDDAHWYGAGGEGADDCGYWEGEGEFHHW